MEEKDFLHEICLTILFASRAVKFCAVVDISGKLVVGERRKDIHCISKQYYATDHYQGSYYFFLNYLIPIMNKRRRSFDNTGGMLEKVHFELLEIDNNTKLAVTPLTENKEMYLCIYLESSAPYHEIISKLSNAI
jgi:hypothetical protein